MSERKTKKQIQELKDKYNVESTWSWSKYKTSRDDLYSYFLKYVKGFKEDNLQNMYSLMGGELHDLIEALILGETTREEAIEHYKSKVIEYSVLGMKYARADEEADNRLSDTYNNSNIHFLENFVIPTTGTCEDFIECLIGKELMIGYSDFTYQEFDTHNIIDWKSSSIYKGKKILEEEGQLLLYAYALSQSGVPINRIKAGWCFTKYADVHIKQKNGKTRVSNMLRCEIGKKLRVSVKSWLKEEGIDDISVELLLDRLEETNDLTILPEHIQSLYKIEDCYVWIDITEDKVKSLVKDIHDQIMAMNELNKRYAKDNNDRIFYNEITKENEYWFYNISGFSRKYHKPWDNYLKEKEAREGKITEREDDEIDIMELLS